MVETFSAASLGVSITIICGIFVFWVIMALIGLIWG